MAERTRTLSAEIECDRGAPARGDNSPPLTRCDRVNVGPGSGQGSQMWGEPARQWTSYCRGIITSLHGPGCREQRHPARVPFHLPETPFIARIALWVADRARVLFSCVMEMRERVAACSGDVRLRGTGGFTCWRRATPWTMFITTSTFLTSHSLATRMVFSRPWNHVRETNKQTPL